MDTTELLNINLKLNKIHYVNTFLLTIANNNKVLIRGNTVKEKSTIIIILLAFHKYLPRLV